MTKFSNIKVGEYLSTTMYMKVLSKNPDGIRVEDSNGQVFDVRGKQLIENTTNSNQQYSTEEKVNKTRAAELLTSAGDSVFTVVFEKQDGTERKLTGRLLETENQMGRSNVADLEITSGNNMRQVDHRTIKYLILKGVKYTVKTK